MFKVPKGGLESLVFRVYKDTNTNGNKNVGHCYTNVEKLKRLKTKTLSELKKMLFVVHLLKERPPWDNPIK